MDSTCEPYNAEDAGQCPLWRANAAHGLLRSRRWEPEGGDRASRKTLASGGQGKEQIIVEILDRMDQDDRSDLPVEDLEDVAVPERPLKLGTRLFPLRRRRQSATRWHQTRAILGWGEMSKKGTVEYAPNASSDGWKWLTR